MKFLFSIPKYIAVGFIIAYQKMLSPDHSWLKSRYPYGFCPLYPSCSQYSKQAIIKHGLIKGLFLTLRRLGKCNPWTNPHLDPVPR